jgi:hypothetical protein
MTKRIDSRGYYELEKHVVVEFILDEVLHWTLEGLSGQNVINSLAIKTIETGFRVTLAPCYGLSGSIEATSVSTRLAPGPPK